MNCKEIEKYLPLYPDDVEPGIREEIEKHLRQCHECNDTYEKLGLYRSYVESAEEPEVPEHFEMDVINELEAGTRPKKIRQFLLSSAVALSSAAALIILFLLFGPSEKPWEDAIEVNFALKEEKMGKGPSASIDFKKIDKSIQKIISETGTIIKEKKKNSITGYYDYMIVSVPGPNLPEFIGKFNHASSMPLNKPDGIEKKGDKVYFKIYFDMINFTTGNFDGDNHADLIVQFISGQNKGKWVLYKNDDSSRYQKDYFIKTGDDETRYLGDYWLLSGDFNGDRIDDILLYEYSKYRGLTSYFLLNNGDYSFREAPATFMELTIPKKGEFEKIISGDGDGDGSDDIMWVAGIGNELFEITAINLDISFKPILIPDFDTCAGIVIAGDMNGDKFTDICVKYMDGTLAGRTDIYLNKQDFSFAEPYYGGLSWAGDYIMWSDDYNGDGLDDLFVKSGGPFLSGDWYVMSNNPSGGLIFETQFHIKYPGSF